MASSQSNNNSTKTVVIPSYRSIDIEPNDNNSNNSNDIDYMSDSIHSSVQGNNTTTMSRQDVLLLPYDNDIDDDSYIDDNTNTYVLSHINNSNEEQHQQRKPLSMMAASLALMKGNLGPGILNLPHAFSKSGPMIGTIMFVIVTVQGLYSMTLLVYCKNQINLHHSDNEMSHPNSNAYHLSRSPVRNEQHRNTVRPQQQQQVSTFMDVTKYTLGATGGRITEIFIFVLQIGVCCVFISLIATNIQVVFVHSTPFLSVSMISLCMMIAITVFRYIHDLFWFNAIANTFMLVAILTATITSCIHIWQQQKQQQQRQNSSYIDNDNTTTATVKTIQAQMSTAITFTADMFFAFEGIGLVLPVENNYNNTPARMIKHHHPNDKNLTTHSTTTATTVTGQTTTLDRHQQQMPSSRWDFSYVLLLSMGCVAMLFALIGLTSSIAYKEEGINNASITAYLKEYYPNIIWYSIVNIMVLFAVALTFPLQLTPAMEVLEKWILDDCFCRCCCNRSIATCINCCNNQGRYNYHRRFFTSISRSDSDDDDGIDIHPTYSSSGNANLGDRDVVLNTVNGTIDYDNMPASSTTMLTSMLNQYGWMFRRWMVVLTCASIVLVVNNDLGLLVSLFGAVGQTGLAAMPCMVHLVLQYQQHIAPKHILLSIADVLVILFCTIVMFAGFYLSIQDIIAKI